MYNDYPNIDSIFESEYFLPLINRAASELAKNERLNDSSQAETFEKLYREQLLELLANTKTVYYQALKCAFDPKAPQDIREIVDVKDFPIDLLNTIDSGSPDAIFHFLQYLGEAEVPLVSEQEAAAFYNESIGILEKDDIYESISPELHASSLGITREQLDQKIGKGAHCSLFSAAVEAMVANRLGLEDFSHRETNSIEAKKLYNRLMSDISELPTVCYAMLHAVASERNVPSFYQTNGIDYLSNDLSNSFTDPLAFVSESKMLAERFENALSDAKVGRFSVTDARAAAQYFEVYSSLEPPVRTVEYSPEMADAYLKEELDANEKAFKLESFERSSAKKSADERFGFYLAQLKKSGELCKEEHDFLSERSKIYKKENERLEAANEKYRKAELKLSNLQRIEDLRDLTPKERKELAKAMREFGAASEKLQALKDELLLKNEQRAASDRRFPEHTQMRAEQIMSGDTSYMPLHTLEDSINNKMYSYRAQIYASDRRELFESAELSASALAVPTEPARTSVSGAALGISSTTRQVRQEIPPSPAPTLERSEIENAEPDIEEK